MPKLVDDETGEVIMDGLRVGELKQLQEFEHDYDIDWDLPEDDDDGPQPDGPVPEADDKDKPDELVESELPSSPEEAKHQFGIDDGGGEVSTPKRQSFNYDDPDEDELERMEDAIEELEDRDEEEIEHNFDVDIEVIEKVDERDRQRWARLVNTLADYGNDVKRRKRERDERIDELGSKFPSRRTHSALRQRAKQSNVIKDLKEGFEKLVSRPVPRPATHGPEMDQFNVVRRAAGDMTIDELFEEEIEVETGDRCVGFATDISGSMRSDIDELKIAGAAFGEMTKIIGDDFVWEAFTDRYHTGYTPSEERLDLRIVTGPDEQFEWKHLDSFDHAKNEPTAAGIRDCRMLMEQTSAREYVMIVVTDGMATVTEDGRRHPADGNEPVEHARQAVQECRADGIDVIGLGIGSMNDDKMAETFGKGNYKLSTIDNLAETILRLYEDQMNVTRR